MQSMAGYVFISSVQSIRRAWLAEHMGQRNVSAHWRLWGRKKNDSHVEQEGALATQLDDMDVDEHASDFIISMLEDKVLGDEEAEQYPGSWKHRVEPPNRPPPMPELSSAATVLEQHGQVAESSIHEPVDEPRHPSEPPLPSAPAMDINGFPEGVQSEASNREDSATEEEQAEVLGDARALKLLRKRQQDNFAANQARPGEDATTEQRIREARLKAAQQAEEEAARQKEYAAVAAEEAARDQMLREKAKKEYEEAEARKAQELEKRVELERIMLRKRREELRAAEEAAQAARDVAEREAAAKRAEQLEQERQQAVEAVKAAEQEKAALNKLRDMLVVRAEGSAVVAAAGPGLTTSGKVSVPAQIEVSAEVRNVLAGEAGPVIGGAADVADATDISITVAGELATLFGKQQMNALVAQEAIGRGPLMKMTRLELEHWMTGFCMALQAAAMSKLRKACAQYASSDASKPQVQAFSIKVERGMLPQSHPKRSHALFEACITRVQQDRAAAEASVYDCLLALSEEERPWTEGGSTEPPAWHLDVVSLAQNWLSQRTLEAEPDSLLDVSEMAYWTIGDKHPITLHMLEAAEKNLSLERKIAVVERQRALDELVEKLQSKDKMTSSEISAELALEKEDLIPVPERVWALRNTASTMALADDKRSRAKARDLFEMALQLQRRHINDPGHPGLLGELWRLSQLLQQDDEWKNDSQELDEQLLEILHSVVEMYQTQGDTLSACVLAEATGTALGRLASSEDKLKQLAESASTFFDELTQPEQDMVLKKRGTVDAVESLVLMFTEELGVYSIRSGNKAHKLWADGKVLPLVQLPHAVRT